MSWLAFHRGEIYLPALVVQVSLSRMHSMQTSGFLNKKQREPLSLRNQDFMGITGNEIKGKRYFYFEEKKAPSHMQVGAHIMALKMSEEGFLFVSQSRDALKGNEASQIYFFQRVVSREQ